MKQLLVLLLVLTAILLNENAHADLNEGLVAHYTFKNNAVDKSGNGNNGTVFGVSYLENDKGTFANFNKEEKDYIQVANSDSLNTSIFSISCWLSISSYETQTIIDKRNGQQDRNFSISIVDKKIIGDIGDGTNYSVANSYDLSLNTMYHIVLTYDQEYLRLYVNGSEKSKYKKETKSNTGNGNLFIGCHGLKTNYFDGLIKSFRIYNRAINDLEIIELQNLEIPVTVDSKITNESFFENKPSLTIDFESFPNNNSISNYQPLTDQYKIYGVIFSSESKPDTNQNVDPEDISNRFDGTLTISSKIQGGGSPHSETKYAYGMFYDSSYTADIRIDFINPTDAFAFYLIDNDFSDARISAYNRDGLLLSRFIVPEVDEGGSTYIGISVPKISYAIIDAKDGLKMDSTFIDDFTFIHSKNQNISNEVYEILWLNSNDNASVVGSKILEKNITFLLKVKGTISLWNPNSWENICKGIPEHDPLFESPEVINGKVGLDANFLFASVDGASYCDENLPLKDFRFEISIDGGISWFHPNFIEDEINSCHTYSYLFNANGYSLQARFKDEPIDDNYGMFQIEIIKTVNPDMQVDGDYNYNEKLDLGDAIGILQELSTLSYSKSTK